MAVLIQRRSIVFKILMCLFSLMLISNAFAYEKCSRTDDGEICCWDTNVDGPFGPPGC